VLLSPRLFGELFLTELDEREETPEAWRLKWEGLTKGFVNYLENRFANIERSLDMLEDRHGHQKD
jgi:hypothetical protein